MNDDARITPLASHQSSDQNVFNTCVIELSSERFMASFSVEGKEYIVGNFPSAQAATIAALLGVKSYFRNRPTTENR
jgi:hypothetical protein